MEFKRTEIRKTVRHYENISEEEDIKSTLNKIKEMKVPCSFKISGYQELGNSYVLSTEGKVLIFSRDQKLKVTCSIKDIKEVEVFSNSEITEEDQKGRWSYI